jgi:hypothetical protein
VRLSTAKHGRLREFAGGSQADERRAPREGGAHQPLTLMASASSIRPMRDH